MRTVIYDIETYPNCFTLTAKLTGTPCYWQFEVSQFKDEGKQLLDWLMYIRNQNYIMVGFNNINFDYPIIHQMMLSGQVKFAAAYNKCVAIITAKEVDRFNHVIRDNDMYLPQIDLFKIHHFDNRARTTSLKALEFNMRMKNIRDLPFKPGTALNQQQIKTLLEYNKHDVDATEEFYFKSLDKIEFRQGLGATYGRNFLNHNDVKIGKELFALTLEQAGIELYQRDEFNKRVPIQTVRNCIFLDDCVPKFIDFKTKEFNSVLTNIRWAQITVTKGAFNDLKCTINGLDFVFGTGGLHASVEQKKFVATDKMMILDIDVTSMYPSIAIGQGYYPEHLGKEFVNIYKDVKEARVKYKKGSVENAALKLALNGVYGDSNNPYSVFYDPLFTMKITIGGQLMLAMLAEKLMAIGVTIIQVNTDGITMYANRLMQREIDAVCSNWEKLCNLQLEHNYYEKMFVADVNTYIAVGEDGKVKRKGRFEYDVEWHQNASMLIVPKVIEQVLVYDKPLRETVLNWTDKMDFMKRVKVTGESRLVLVTEGRERELEKTQRYYVSITGGNLVKVMPPLKGKVEYRRIGIGVGHKVTPCNDLDEATAPINYEYYISEIENCLALL